MRSVEDDYTYRPGVGNYFGSAKNRRFVYDTADVGLSPIGAGVDEKAICMLLDWDIYYC